MLNNDLKSTDLIYVSGHGTGMNRTIFGGNFLSSQINNVLKRYKYVIVLMRFKGALPNDFQVGGALRKDSVSQFCPMKLYVSTPGYVDRNAVLNLPVTISTYEVPQPVAVNTDIYAVFDTSMMDATDGNILLEIGSNYNLDLYCEKFDVYVTDSEAYNFFFDPVASTGGRTPDVFAPGAFAGTKLTIPVTKLYNIEVWYQNQKIDPKVTTDNMDTPSYIYVDFVVNPPTSEVKVIYS